MKQWCTCIHQAIINTELFTHSKLLSERPHYHELTYNQEWKKFRLISSGMHTGMQFLKHTHTQKKPPNSIWKICHLNKKWLYWKRNNKLKYDDLEKKISLLLFFFSYLSHGFLSSEVGLSVDKSPTWNFHSSRFPTKVYFWRVLSRGSPLKRI